MAWPRRIGRGAYTILGAPKNILINGTVPRDWEAKAERYAEQGKKHGSVVKDPRTAIAYSDRYLYFLVIDGRSKESVALSSSRQKKPVSVKVMPTLSLERPSMTRK